MEEINKEEINLMKYSHGAGCGCKIAPQVLEEILKNSNNITQSFPHLLIGNSSKDDAAVYQINDEQALIATTDFFTPIVNDPFTFGKVAAANAISDVYAMGGQPIMALAILGWPVEKLPISIAGEVMKGAESVCAEAGIPIAGGHSIDTPEPIFGLSVNGIVHPSKLKHNDQAQEGDLILLTKPIGIGVFSTALKRGAIEPDDLTLLHNLLTKLNKIGQNLAAIPGVHAMTDVTGFGLGGHLIEMAEGSNISTIIKYNKLNKLPGIGKYLAKNIIPDATYRNWKGFGHKIKIEPSVNYMEAFQLLPDPQTNGGILISVAPDSLEAVQNALKENGYADFIEPIGIMVAKAEKVLTVK